MKIEIVENPNKELLDEIDKKIEEYNLIHWEVKEKNPIAFVIKDDNCKLIAGASAKTFGYWLLIDNIWVSEHLRGQKIGSELLHKLEKLAIQRGCKFSLLDTLDFQAKPFYEKYGYKLQWTQSNYPKNGLKYFMTKELK